MSEIETMRNTIPHKQDTFEYRIEQNENRNWGIVVESPCPHCGNDTVFSGTIEENAQYVAHDTTDNGEPWLGADDVMSVEVGYICCNQCNEMLVENGD